MLLLRVLETALGKAVESDLPKELEREAAGEKIRQLAINLSQFDFQPISDRLDHGKKLFEIQEEQSRLSKQLELVLAEVKSTLGPIPE